jgi:hypothetical protein
VLHTFSAAYVMEDLEEFMKEKGVLLSWEYIMLHSNLIEEGVADLHCRSSQYLAEIIINERNLPYG